MIKQLQKIFKISLFFTAVAIIVVRINPFDNEYFVYHDQTQPARLTEFYLNIANLKLPPRLAPNFYFNLSYPVFNFYSPASYWFSSIFMMFHLNSGQAIELSFNLIMVLGFVSMFLFLKDYFSFLPSLLGAVAYVTTPYLAVEIFVRGNLGELFFWAILPLTLYFLNKQYLFRASLAVSLLLTSHNVLSAMSIPLLIIWALTRKSRLSLISVVFGFLISLYFLLPALLELNLTWAKDIAKMTNYQDHFLCLKQLWADNGWMFGGSVAGCYDYLSFKLGKLHILIFALALIYFSYTVGKNKNIMKYKDQVIILLFGVLATFFTLNYSKFIWDKLSFAIAVFQFPWRFLIYTIFSLSFFIPYSVYLLKSARLSFKLASIMLIFLLLSLNQKYFIYRINISQQEFQRKYLSKDYIQYVVVKHIPEYLSKDSDYKYVLKELAEINKKFSDNQSLDEYDKRPSSTNKIAVLNYNNKLFYKELKLEVFEKSEFSLPIHFVTNWSINLNNQTIEPKRYDSYGRPILNLEPGKHLIKIKYKQTPTQKIANIITIVSFIILTIISYNLSRKNAKKL
ncbi:MAG: hypothetical protein KatS3mg090_0859 [Patescibacteria group bacterium]|nr:MAG: hypothetical protein KatS3mg090_0859 [Patescibacteria group bacterium]